MPFIFAGSYYCSYAQKGFLFRISTGADKEKVNHCPLNNIPLPDCLLGSSNENLGRLLIMVVGVIIVASY